MMYKHWGLLLSDMANWCTRHPGLEILCADSPSFKIVGFVSMADPFTRWEIELHDLRDACAGDESVNLSRSSSSRVQLVKRLVAGDGLELVRNHMVRCPTCVVASVLGS